MFKIINQLLQLDDFYGVSKEIDLLKGIDKYPDSFTEAFQQAKRKIKAKK